MSMKNFVSQRQKTGKVGESLAVNYLQSRGYSIKERNYTKKAGEIDIVAAKNGTLYFFEVKTGMGQWWNPLENITQKKIMRMNKAVELYLLEKYPGRRINYYLSAVVVWLDTPPVIHVIENLLIGS